MMEFIFETTRSICDMILSGVLERFPNLRVLVPHAGAALPVLTERIDLLLPLLGRSKGTPPKSTRETLRNLHFDLAGAPIPELLGALLQMQTITASITAVIIHSHPPMPAFHYFIRLRLRPYSIRISERAFSEIML
jgi:hypothetical protein